MRLLGDGLRLESAVLLGVGRRLDALRRRLDLLDWLRTRNGSPIGFVFAHLLQLDLSGEHLLDAVRQTFALRSRVERDHLLNVPSNGKSLIDL